MKEKKNLWAYVANLIVAFSIFGFCATIWDLFSKTDSLSVIKILSDCFLLPGVILVGISVLGWISSKGTFDIFGYSIHGLFNLWKKESYYKQESYYDYKQKKDEKRKPFRLPMFLVGLIFFLAGVALTVAFLMME